MALRGIAGLAFALFSSATQAKDMIVYVGTQGNAILAGHLDADTGKLGPIEPAAQITRPTWIATDPTRRILYAVSEVGNYDDTPGQVASFAIDAKNGALKPLSIVESGGNGPTHLSYSAREKTLFVAHFGKGQVAALPVAADGRIGSPASVVLNQGSGPSTKQKGPHAHQAVLAPGGQVLVVPDMGADRLFLWKFDKRSRALTKANPATVSLPPGSGPRHIASSPDGRNIYLLTELSAEIVTYHWKASHLIPIQTTALDGDLPPVSSDGSAKSDHRSAAEIAIDRRGRFIYASNRARNLIQVYARDPLSGRLNHVQDISSGGDTPRSFAIAPGGRWLLAGNQASQSVQIFEIDAKTGRLSPRGAPVPIATEKPVAFAFYPPIP